MIPFSFNFILSSNVIKKKSCHCTAILILLRIMCIYLLALNLAACVTIQKNYLGASLTGHNIHIQLYKPYSDFEINSINRKVDSLLHIMTLQKKDRRSLKAADINQLYTAFGKQLNQDRYYNSILQREGFNSQDNLQSEKYFAAIKLLISASEYNRSYHQIRFVRRAVNRGDSGNNIPKRVLRKSDNYLYSCSVRKEISKQNKKLNNSGRDSLVSLLPCTNLIKSCFRRIYQDNDRFHDLLYGICRAGSYAVGNGIGIFHGLPNGVKNAKTLLPNLKPFDIILVKSPDHLTGKLVPGYFGHAAIWLGPRSAKRFIPSGKLKFEKQQSETAVKSVVEVLRSGVKISSLEEFADGEDFLVLRIKNLSKSQKRSILVNVRKQLHKGYDFNFDIESPEAISCTELIFLAYDFIDWQVRYTWLRFTISPVDLAFTALNSEQFEFPLFVLNGTAKINPDKNFVNSIIEPSAQLSIKHQMK